jgi:hypothetical protein
MNESTLFIIIGIILVALFVIGYFLQRNLQIQNYESAIVGLHSELSAYPVSDWRFSNLLDQFELITKNNRDRKRTADLWLKFVDKYEDYTPVAKMQGNYIIFKTIQDKIL